ncbi:hypothetical protein J8I29_01305 [Labrys sp. LIt4]|nr:hypothetical protein [Labrys sp. LIt4]
MNDIPPSTGHVRTSPACGIGSVPPVIAGLAVQGGAIVNGVYRLDRGFESLERKLAACGTQIERGLRLRPWDRQHPAGLQETAPFMP